MSERAALYDWPLYYDIAFNWDASGEVAMLERAIADHAPAPDAARRVLEPGCGTGRVLVALAMAGFDAVGYDANPAMVAYARQRIEQTGLADRLRVVGAEMTRPLPAEAIAEPFDAAFCPMSSLSHLADDAAIAAHFRATADALAPGGIYLFQLATVWEPELGHEPSFWTTQRDGVRVRVEWVVEHDDPEARISRQRCAMTVEDPDAEGTIEHVETLDMRLWLDADVRRLLEGSDALELIGAYDEAGRPLPLDQSVTADDGNAWWVARRSS